MGSKKSRQIVSNEHFLRGSNTILQIRTHTWKGDLVPTEIAMLLGDQDYLSDVMKSTMNEYLTSQEVKESLKRFEKQSIPIIIEGYEKHSDRYIFGIKTPSSMNNVELLKYLASHKVLFGYPTKVRHLILCCLFLGQTLEGQLSAFDDFIYLPQLQEVFRQSNLTLALTSTSAIVRKLAEEYVQVSA